MGLRVHYSINFTSQSSGTNDIQDTKSNSTEKNAAILHLAKTNSNHSYSLGRRIFRSCNAERDLRPSEKANSKLDMPVISDDRRGGKETETRKQWDSRVHKQKLYQRSLLVVL